MEYEYSGVVGDEIYHKILGRTSSVGQNRGGWHAASYMSGHTSRQHSSAD
jgi:hypothetical protein